MRLTNILLKQHNGWLQKLKWKIQGKRNIYETGIAASLQKRGIAVRDALDYAKPEFITP
jgi:predicted GNAT family acetyltransferase